MYGLDLFSGIGGITKALDGYVQPIAYCENDRYAQGVLLSRMRTGDLPTAPIWDDVRTLTREAFGDPPDIIYGGFPCQDISVAGRGAGLGGSRSGLFFEIARLVGELRPEFVFLENVSAIRLRGGSVVVGELARLGYDCRWDVLSASDVGANHQRERWWLLAYARHGGGGDIRTFERGEAADSGEGIDTTAGDGNSDVAHPDNDGPRKPERDATEPSSDGEKDGLSFGNDSPMADTTSQRCREAREFRCDEPSEWFSSRGKEMADTYSPGFQNIQGQRANARSRRGTLVDTKSWWATEPNVGRVAHGIPQQVDRLRALGNSVVPVQAREAFERLMGLK